ncbi:hypothetical protein [Bacillus benzoevorans]|uniref:Uracil DNA glycosylase superfamily protein n=1 Tax=Bacillus benzoevorans TaxID=1456 RepID=A0A7X0HRK9_9BACI|nr:hypothetical protein [Bacillus benzoevorans]MBB6444291.1 hypothetical protein [Bacillus benzoevorans]
MTIAGYAKFQTYKNLLLSLPQIDETALKSEAFLLDKDEKKNIEIYYAPFEHINEHAKVVIAGITPGLHQMKISYNTVKQATGDFTDEEILHKVKKNSSFEGSMRKNLIGMLDELQLQNFLGIFSTSELFAQKSDLVHTTSVITYPVFKAGKNYNGSSPDILKTELLKKYIVDNFVTEFQSLDNPLIIPLGVNVEKVLDFLAQQKVIKADSILSGFPHPSGGNGHRHKQFAHNKKGMALKLEQYFSQ